MTDLSALAVAKNFISIRKQTEDGGEYWLARDLSEVLEYAQYRSFESVIEKAKEACKKSGYHIDDHFADIRKMVRIGSDAQRPIDDVKLSRYACYLIVQNGDSSKEIIAKGQTYFAIQTRRQELADEKKFSQLSEDDRRLMLRYELTHHNKALSSAAQAAGVTSGLDYAIFQDHGYKGLYGGLSNKDIHSRKKLKQSEKILDHMGSTELAANLFRATQTEEKLRRDGVKSKSAANQAHYDVGAKVRQTIKDIGGVMPENLPKPEKSIQELSREKKKHISKK